MNRRFVSSLFVSASLLLGTGLRAADDSAPTPATQPSKPVVLSNGTEEMKVKLPKALFIVTPKNLPADVERAAAARGPIMVPAGTTNIALNKPVTSSDTNPLQGDLKMLTDGDKEGKEGSFVELAPGVQWMQVDLQKEATIYGVMLWHYHADVRFYNDVVVQVSNDPEFKKDVTTLFNNDQANEAGLGAGKDRRYIEGFEGKLIDAKGTKARYIRCFSNGYSDGSANHYIELEVYGAAK